MRKSFRLPRCAVLLLAAHLCLPSAGCQHAPRCEAGLTKVTLAGRLVSATRARRFLYRAGERLLQGRRTRRDDPARRALPQRRAAGGLGRGAVRHGLFGQDSGSRSPTGSRWSPWPPRCRHDPQGIMVRKDSPIHSFADLNGHTVAIKTGSTWFEFIVKRYQLNNVHEVPAMMNVANFVADPQYIQQAFATSEPFFAHQAGVETRVLLTSDAGYNPYRVMFTTRIFLRAASRNRRQICARFPERMAGLSERSCRRARRDRQVESRAQAGLDAISPGKHCATAISLPAMIRAARNSARWIRSAGPAMYSELGRSESDRQAVRSHDGVHVAVHSQA